MRASIILFFGATTVFTFISYIVAGIITIEALWLAALVAPAYRWGCSPARAPSTWPAPRSSAACASH